MKISSTRFVLLACAVVCCACLFGQSEKDSSKTPPLDEGTPRHVSGHVIDDLTGKPIGGAKVRLYVVVMHSNCINCGVPQKPPEQPPPPREVMSGEDGSFTFDNVLHRPVNLAASKDGYLSSMRSRRRPRDPLGDQQIGKKNWETPDKSIDSMVVQLAPEATISGVLRHHDGSPVTVQPKIALMQVHAWAGFPREEYDGGPKYQDDGSYRFKGQFPGCYYLVATLYHKQKDPARLEIGHAYDEVPVRYPALSEPKTSSCFTLREGEQRTFDLTLPEKEVHRVTATSSPVTVLAENIRDEGGGYYRFNELYPENKYEAWLPDGRYWLENGAGEISGPLPFTVNNADLNDLHFTIQPPNSTWVKVPVELSVPSHDAPKNGVNGAPCGFVTAKLVRFDQSGYVAVGDDLGFTLGKDCGKQKPVAASMAPGTYIIVVNTTWLNYYVKSIRSGDFDLSQGPLEVRPGETPKPIKIELAQGGKIKGSLQLASGVGTAFVYALSLGTAGKADFRLLQPAYSRNGAFEMLGMAPGAYIVYASYVELDKNRQYLTENEFWLAHGKKIDVAAGETSEVDLTAYDPPNEP